VLFQEVCAVPYFVEWLRYSGFIVLYPIGVASELTMIYRGLPHMKGNGAPAAHPPRTQTQRTDGSAQCR
jgi:hypothetical protein